MAVCICKTSALQYWTSIGVRESQASNAPLDALRALSPASLGMNEAVIDPSRLEVPSPREASRMASGLIPGLRPPVHILTSRSGWRPPTLERRCHAISSCLSPESLYWVAPNIAVTSPELVFVQLASSLPQLSLVRLAASFAALTRPPCVGSRSTIGRPPQARRAGSLGASRSQPRGASSPISSASAGGPTASTRPSGRRGTSWTEAPRPQRRRQPFSPASLDASEVTAFLAPD